MWTSLRDQYSAFCAPKKGNMICSKSWRPLGTKVRTCSTFYFLDVLMATSIGLYQLWGEEKSCRVASIRCRVYLSQTTGSSGMGSPWFLIFFLISCSVILRHDRDLRYPPSFPGRKKKSRSGSTNGLLLMSCSLEPNSKASPLREAGKMSFHLLISVLEESKHEEDWVSNFSIVYNNQGEFQASKFPTAT